MSASDCLNGPSSSTVGREREKVENLETRYSTLSIYSQSEFLSPAGNLISHETENSVMFFQTVCYPLRKILLSDNN